MKIAIFEPQFLTPRAFAASHIVLLQDQATMLSKLGNEIVILTEKALPHSRINVPNLRLRLLSGKFSLVKLWLMPQQICMSMLPDFFSLDIIREALKALRREKPDVLYSCGSPFFSIFTALLGYRSGIPTVYYVFTPAHYARWWKGETTNKYSEPAHKVVLETLKQTFRQIPRRGLLMRWGLNHVNKLIVSSKFVKASLDRLCDTKKIPIVYPSTKIPPLKHSSITNQVIITYYGHLRPRRGVIDLVHAFTKVADEFSNIRLMLAISNIHEIYGSMTLRICKKVLKQHELESSVIWKGIVSNVYSEILQPSSLLVLPQHEPSIKIIESMAAGKPVITTKAGWAPEIISNGVNGCLVEVGKVQQIVASIKKLISDYELAIQIGENAWKTVKEKCNLTRSTKELIKIFEKLN
ncbi:hypothetical protein DRO69_09260 [Candidatus Bathyarchaeota archaeon]|nr:MAG: hypothetical protein DRO69_09260 [Candidatus Bathyarchaeota archaeon]